MRESGSAHGRFIPQQRICLNAKGAGYWVDAAEFALVKMEIEPAKNPSFWITRTRILQTYAKTGDFWLPERNRSETKVRIGGTAVFTIDYGAYRTELNAAY